MHLQISAQEQQTKYSRPVRSANETLDATRAEIWILISYTKIFVYVQYCFTVEWKCFLQINEMPTSLQG